MDGQRFDALTRALARSASRRATLRGMSAAVAAFFTASGGSGAHPRGYLGPGDPCYDDAQCRSSDTTAYYCADNGFAYDGPLNCCAFTGGYCSRDEGCCGALLCGHNTCGGLAPGIERRLYNRFQRLRRLRRRRLRHRRRPHRRNRHRRLSAISYQLSAISERARHAVPLPSSLPSCRLPPASRLPRWHPSCSSGLVGCASPDV